MAKLLLGTRKGLLIRDSSRIVEEAFVGVAVSLAELDPYRGHYWACLDHGHWGCKLHRSVDQGKSWTELTAPSYPEGAEIRPGVVASLKYLWGFASDQSGRIYLGTEPGGLFVSSDGDLPFHLVDSLWNSPQRNTHWLGGGRDEAGIHSILIDPRDERRILVGVSCAGVFESCDGGSTWEVRNHGLQAGFLPEPNSEIGHDPHLLTWCLSQPDVLWQQNHCGIFRSTDAARSWSAIHQEDGPAKFGFAIAAHPSDPETAWVVPAQADEFRLPQDRSLCVCRTQDGGKTWQRLSKGLPQSGCYDLVYRHCLALQGDDLAFGTTTGNLYASGDGGDSWTLLSSSLPPIYSVHFL
jgi:photosystem II stability/assembly factor-like uncharacterized protein